MTGRDKHRFDEFFQRRRWKKEYWSEYHATMHRCGSYDDGYYCTLTTEEHLALWKRNHRQTVQNINEICGKPSRRIV
jgi:hypothetical protein